MKKVVTISKGGSVKDEKIKSFNLDEIYKKCKLKKADNFSLRHSWSFKNQWVSLYAKDKGRANSENKYDLPPPIDSNLYFGTMILIKHKNKKPKNNEVFDFTKEEWLKLYEKLFGGFEDLGDEDSYSEDEEDIPDELKTKHGYLKDGFVVSSEGDEEDEDYVPNDEEEEDEDEDDVDGVSDSDEEADYGGETEEEMENQFEDDEDDDENEFDDEEDPASELSEEEYSY
jgi:hypothetical protein